ncbi:chromosome segregation protein SMC [Desulfurobacterium thermolithotrophum]|uniref:chromosome segregation protein SMC n=1 Tax=Desulfurobacterium thermolithotrophum TaxID=64160 RepID=UPI0013D73FED|nr:chromosome segregation protein SMC [Desulfurobacterium thermolithotrophum]
MFIKSLKLKGFKSFADETEIRFSKGINCIVGPNGCGKSNIVDALKWIVGDTSIKGMRASNIKDVIFKGSEAKRAARSAEVSITLVKDDLFTFSESEVEVSRKVKFSGDSDFLINGRKVRLKDIQEFFSSIGLGNRDYAFFEQGQIDRVLKMKPQERRLLIDEAAGITSFKEKKEETLQKLSEAEQNLESVRSVIDEVGKNLRTLKSQAEKAKKFQELRNLEKELELKLLGLQLKNLRLEKEVSESSLKLLQEDRISLEREVSVLQVELEELRKELESITKEIEETSQELYEVEKSKKEASVKREFLQKEIKRLEEELKEKTFEREHKIRKMESIRKELQLIFQEESELQKKLKDLENREKERERIVKELQQKRKAFEERLKELKSSLSTTSTQISKLQLDMAREEERFKSLKNIKEKLPGEIEKLQKEKEYYLSYIERFVEKENSLKEKIEKLKEELENLKKEKKELLERLEVINSEVSEKREEIVSLSSKIESTEKFLTSINLGKLEEKIVESGKEGKVKGYIGLLVNLIDVDNGWEKIVESYLSRFGAGIVLETFEDVVWVKERIKGNGRVLLLSADVRNVEKIEIEEARPVISHVKPKDLRISNLVNVLFSNVFFVPSGAERLAKKYPQCVFIDEELNIFAGTGSIVGKFKKNSLLEMEKELENLKEKLTHEKKVFSCLQSKVLPIREEIDEKEEEIDSLKEAIQQKKMELFEVGSKIKEARRKLADLERKENELEDKLKRAVESINSYNSRKDIFLQKIESLSKKKDELVKEIEKLEEDIKELEANIGIEKEELSKYVSKKILLAEKLKNLKEKKESKERFVRTLQKEIEEIEKRIEKDEENLKKAAIGVKRAEEILGGVDESIDEIKKELQLLEERRGEITSIVKTKEEALKSKNKDLSEVQNKLKETEVAVARFNVKEEEIISKILELEKSVSEALEAALAVGSEEEVKKELINLKEKISKIGNVNFLAIEEYEKVKERYGFILEQEKDLIESIKNLREAIRKLDEEIEKKFTETLKAVNRNFRRTFKQIFGGGDAKLILTDKNISEAGIEIEAKPPGKKHSNINLLSGGERTLVALAFLYALYSVRPAPFVVLDEVDAALDDANTLRFIELLKQMALETQVIVVTHNKLTMEAADVLYGVTMEVPGVSKIIGVSFESTLSV